MENAPPTFFMTLLFIAISLVLVALNGFFVAAEFAIVKVRRTRLEELAGQGVKAARVSIVCVDQLDESLSATQLGITLVSLALGWIGEEAFYNLLVLAFAPGFAGHTVVFHSIAIAISFFIITLLHVVLGELVPKSMAIQRADEVALRVARPLFWFYRAARPLIHAFTGLANIVLHRVGFHGLEEEPLSEEELKLVMRDSHEEGVISDSEAQIITRAFEFSDKRVGEIMVPAAKMQYLSLARDVEENLRTTRDHMYTRFPLVTDGLDSVIGVVHMKDAWREICAGRSNDVFEKVARKPIMVDPRTRQDKLMKTLKDTRCHMAIVREPSTHKVLGLVTLEDVLEDLVGEIRDEHGH